MARLADSAECLASIRGADVLAVVLQAVIRDGYGEVMLLAHVHVSSRLLHSVQRRPQLPLRRDYYKQKAERALSSPTKKSSHWRSLTLIATTNCLYHWTMTEHQDRTPKKKVIERSS